MNPRALALDVGSTRLKLAALMENGSLKSLGDRAFPAYSGKGLVRESDPVSFRDRIDALLRKAVGLKSGSPLGLSVQRSSFLIWDSATGRPLTKILSWQDRRAENWCQERQYLQPTLWEKTGLPLSPHYAGPKLAFLLATYPWLAKMAAKGKCCFGTLDTFLIWHWSGGQSWQIEEGMAARTLLLKRDSGNWDLEILEQFGIPRSILPEIVKRPDPGCITPGGWEVRSVVPDQTAAVLPLLELFPNAAVLNAGTGTFLLRQARGSAPSPFITMPRPGNSNGKFDTYWEGTINAGALLWNRWKTYLVPEEIPLDRHFAAPEEMGWAAPYWRGDLGQICTDPNLPNSMRANLLLEGYVFRIRQIVEALFLGQTPQPFIFGGGLVQDMDWVHFVGKRLPWPIFTLNNHQLSLWGAGWKADHYQLRVPFQPQPVQVTFQDVYEARYRAWLEWMASVANSASSGKEKFYST